MGPGRGSGHPRSTRRGLGRAVVVGALAISVAAAALGCSDGGGGGPVASTPRSGSGNPTISAPPATTRTDDGGEPGIATPDPGPSPSTDVSAAPTSVPEPTSPIPVGPVDGVPAVPDSPATALLDRLRVANVPADLPDYRRKAFGSGWEYDGRSGCNTRELVLIEESLDAPVMGERCKPLSGRWVSVYDGVGTSDPTDLEIDHFVPLAEAWRTGATAWTEARREAFANDLDDPATLVAVTTRSNRSKGDSPPDEWLPPSFDARCEYVDDWIRVKARWDLAVSPPEKATLVQVLSGC